MQKGPFRVKFLFCFVLTFMESYIAVNCYIYFSLKYNVDFHLFPYLRPNLHLKKSSNVYER